MKIVVAITAASGAVYARLTLERLLRSSEVSRIALVCSAHARAVMAHEGVVLPEDGRIREFANDDLFAPPPLLEHHVGGWCSWCAKRLCR